MNIKIMKKTISFILIGGLLSGSFSVQSAEEEKKEKVVNKYELDSDEEKLLDKNTLSYRANELKDMYAATAIQKSISFDRSYMIDSPLTLEEALDFNHPYLDIMLTDLTTADRDAIIESIKNDAAKNQRLKSIMLTAMKFSTDAALYKRTRNFHNKLLTEHYSDMSQIFPFHMLTLEGGLIKPAVVEEIGFTRSKKSRRVLVDVNKRYRIKSQAEVILKPQTFMDFFGDLLTDKPRSPNLYMLPLTEEELEYWRKGVLNGWLEGNRLANEIIKINLRELVSEWTGQIRYSFLARAKILSRPTAVKLNVGTNTNGLAINIGESIFEITDLPRFNDDELEWLALPQVDDIFDELTKSDVDELSIYLNHPGDVR